jgi:Ca2+-binding RTX toxin-like protein
MSRPAVTARLESQRRHRKLFFGCEQLEDRKLLAMMTVEAPPGVLTITGDGANDVAIIESNVPGSVDVDDGTGLSATTYVNINQIIFNGNGGNDELRIIQNNVTGPTANNIFRPSGGIQFNGGPGSDLLTMAGGTTATFGAGTYTPGVPGAGEVRYVILTPGPVAVVDVDFTDVELINDTTTAGAFTAVQGNFNDTMVIEPGPTLPPVGGLTQGPVFIDGGDRDQHGTHTTFNVATGTTTDGWLFIQQAINFVHAGAFNGAPNDILAIGVTGGTGAATAGGNIFWAAAELGLNVTHVNTPAAIAAVNFNNYNLIYVPSNSVNTGGGIDGANLDALAARTADIQQFVRNGGGIVAQTDADADLAFPANPARQPYDWLEIPNAFTIQDFGAGGISDQLRKTTQAIAAGFTISDADLTDGIPYHNTFTGPPGFNGLDVFVLDRGPNGVAQGPTFPAGDDRAVTLGQGAINTQIGGGATLRITGTLTTIQVGQKTSLTGNTGDGNDSLTLNGATTSLDVIGIPVTLTAGLGTDTVNITDAADMLGDNVTINHLQVTGLSPNVIPYSGAETLTVGTTQGNDNIIIDFTAAVTTTSAIISSFNGNDTFGTLPANRVRPSLVTTITLHGGAPIVPVGDQLNLDMSATTAPIFVDTVGGQALSQSHKPIFWTSIETYDVIDDSGAIPNVDQGDLFVRTTTLNDYVVFSRGSGVSTRVRVNNAIYTFFPNLQIICYGREGDDYITASNILLPVDFRGEVGNDYLTGGVANDWLAGGLDNDRINGSHGDNVIWGDDSPVPNTANPQDLNVGGDDILSGLGGADVFYGGGGNDQVSGGAGNDYAHGGFGNDTLDGNDGDDRLYGGAGNDSLSGYNGNDLLSAGDGADLLYGQSGNDVMIGGIGADLVDGGDGNDLLIGGSVANQSTSRTSLATTATFPAANYTNAADNDAAMLIVLAAWSAPINTISGSLGVISHDGDNDDLWGGLGDDDFCWELADVVDNPPGASPPDYQAPGMGTDQRINPIA